MGANQEETAGATTGVSGDQTFRAQSGSEDGNELRIFMIRMKRRINRKTFFTIIVVIFSDQTQVSLILKW